MGLSRGLGGAGRAAGILLAVAALLVTSVPTPASGSTTTGANR